MIPDVPPSELKRVEYADMRLPAVGGSHNAYTPAILVRIRPFDAALPCSNDRMVKTTAVLDTGATVSSVPMWLLEQLGISVNEGSRRTVFGAGGDFDAHAVKVGAEIDHDNDWLDIGVVDALAPDTPQSHDPKFHLPLLLGQRGFFDRFDTCFSESQRAVWLRRMGGWPQGGAAAQ